MKAKAYLAGKITGDPNYRAKFNEAAAKLEEQGYSVLNPATMPDGMESADYMQICFCMIDVAGTIFFLPDWQSSPGAMLEHLYCTYCNKQIVHLESEVNENAL